MKKLYILQNKMRLKISPFRTIAKAFQNPTQGNFCTLFICWDKQTKQYNDVLYNLNMISMGSIMYWNYPLVDYPISLCYRVFPNFCMILDEDLDLESRDTKRECRMATKYCNDHGECVEDGRGGWYCKCELPYIVGGSESSCQRKSPR